MTLLDHEFQALEDDQTALPRPQEQTSSVSEELLTPDLPDAAALS
ncbi:MAG: hypothetical protein ABIZ07_01425 [Dermatophilaceae bacterium]